MEASVLAVGCSGSLCFPRNRLFPPLLASETWRIASDTFARVVRVAPKSSFEAHEGMILKVLRGETNEVPTPLAPCKACRSCLCPDYLPEVIAGAEGAILLVVWRTSSARHLADLEAQAHDLPFFPTVAPPVSSRCDGEFLSVDASRPLQIEEADIHVCELTFYRAVETIGSGGGGGLDATAAAGWCSYDRPEDGVFGEISVALTGPLCIEWKRVSSFPDTAEAGPGSLPNSEEVVRKLQVPLGFEHGPFYSVDAEGHLQRRCNGQLLYAPHRMAQISKGTVWATVRLPVVKSDVAGPHRHCYT